MLDHLTFVNELPSGYGIDNFFSSNSVTAGALKVVKLVNLEWEPNQELFIEIIILNKEVTITKISRVGVPQQQLLKSIKKFC
jgi:hypothetical protein